MDHHRSRKSGRHKSKDQTHRHESGHHPSRSWDRVVLDAEKRPHDSRQHERSVLPSLRAEDDFVQNWLAQISKEESAATSAFRKLTSDHEQSRMSPSDFLSRNKRPRPPEDLYTQRKKPQHRSSSDSSLLGIAIKPKPQALATKVSTTRQQASSSLRPPKRHRREPSDSGTSKTSNEREETFEKRARFKTREDRYEPRDKSRKPVNPNGNSRSKSKREKRGDRKKAAKKSGEELIRKFSSKSIGQHRLTIPPSHGLGLFKNGRASSPAKRRGLPDLAFSEMDFLQRASHASAAKKEDITKSRSREKEKRKAERVQNEISTFFGPKGTPLYETSSNFRSGGSSTYTSVGHPWNSKDVNAVPDTRSQQLGLQEKPYGGQGRSRSLSHTFSTPNRVPARADNLIVLDSARRCSEKATTYITWSETQFSPVAPPSYQTQNPHQTQLSPTPDSVRRSIENTGIFRDTGISAPQSRGSAKISPRQAKVYSQQYLRDARAEAEVLRSATISSDIVKSKISEASHPLSSRNENHNTSAALHDLDLKKRATIQVKDQKTSAGIGKPDGVSESTRQTLIEHSDPKSGWHQCDNSRTPEGLSKLSASKGATGESKSKPLTREQIARTARIRHLSTTIPVSGESREEDPQLTGEKTTKPSEGAAIVIAGRLSTNVPSSPSRINDQHLIVQPNPQRTVEIPLPFSFQQGSLENPDDLQGLESNLQSREQMTVPSSITGLPNGELGSETGISQRDDMGSSLTGVGPELPVLRSWIGRSFEQAHQATRVSSVVDPAPLYVQQIEQGYAPVEQQVQRTIDNRPRYLEEYIKEHEMGIGPELLYLDGQSLGDGYQPWEDTPEEILLHRDNQELLFDGEASAIDPGNWKHINEDSMEQMDSLRVSDELPADFVPNNEMDYSRENLMPLDSTIGEEYQEPSYMEDISMRGFWQPRRFY